MAASSWGSRHPGGGWNIAPFPATGQTAVRTSAPLGWICLQAESDENLSVLVELGDQAPDPTAGYGGWDEIDRQRDKALSRWTGFKALALDVDLWIDGYETRTPVDSIIDTLEALAGRGRKRTGGEPPKLIVDTAGLMRHDVTVFPNVRWVIVDLQWSQSEDESIVGDDGTRLRACCTITLREHVDAARLQDRALQSRLAHADKSFVASKRYTVKAGDTLISIARKRLGDPGRWLQLAEINGIRDPTAVKPGASIRLP